MKYPAWLKRLLLPFEFEDHPLHYKAVEEMDDNEASLRILLGDEFVDRLDEFAPTIHTKKTN